MDENDRKMRAAMLMQMEKEIDKATTVEVKPNMLMQQNFSNRIESY